MVHISDGVFGDVVTEWGTVSHSNETIRLTGDFAVGRGVAALTRAAERFMLIDERGVEHADWEQLAASDLDLYTPNYVSDPEAGPDGIELYVDCKGGVEPAMRERFLVVLREELADLSGARVDAVT